MTGTRWQNEIGQINISRALMLKYWQFANRRFHLHIASRRYKLLNCNFYSVKYELHVRLIAGIRSSDFQQNLRVCIINNRTTLYLYKGTPCDAVIGRTRYQRGRRGFRLILGWIFFTMFRPIAGSPNVYTSSGEEVDGGLDIIVLVALCPFC